MSAAKMSEKQACQILIVDDSSTVRELVSRYLDESYIALQASNGEQAWQMVQANSDISLIISDLNMPVMNGMELLRQIRASDCKRVSSLPVIMLTGHADTEAAKLASYNMGATDFISKPFTEIDIRSRVRSYIQLNRSIAVLEQNSTFDDVTGLLNRHGFDEQARRAFANNERHGYDLSVVRLQITEIDRLLEKYGKAISSRIIKAVSERLDGILREDESLAHFGSGHFAVLLPMTRAFKAHIVAMRLKEKIENLTFQLSDGKVKTGVAIGLHSTESGLSTSMEQFMQQVTRALEASRGSMSNHVVRYDETLEEVGADDQVCNTQLPGEITAPQHDVTDEVCSQLLVELESTDMARYFAAILSADYECIAERHLDALIVSHSAFLSYAQNAVKAG